MRSLSYFNWIFKKYFLHSKILHYSSTSHVSIYHMYWNAFLLIVKHSNTSHVSIYLSTLSVAFSTFLYSNTSHVLIYHCTKLHKIIFVKNSNTSHVLIYQQTAVARFTLAVFKYISCSYLSCCRRYSDSTNMVIQIHLMFLFITYWIWM